MRLKHFNDNNEIDGLPFEVVNSAPLCICKLTYASYDISILSLPSLDDTCDVLNINYLV